MEPISQKEIEDWLSELLVAATPFDVIAVKALAHKMGKSILDKGYAPDDVRKFSHYFLKFYYAFIGGIEEELQRNISLQEDHFWLQRGLFKSLVPKLLNWQTYEDITDGDEE